jgi:hypothetical protein
MNFEEWKKTGPQLIKALRDRGEESSFRRLLSDLYPKKAHFIYELFQNAEDAGARTCKFTLTNKELIFEHDGRIFVEQDVVGITGIGNSTKKNDPTKIGKFGVGFKAVFAYTNTPEIYSGRFSFRIRDLLVIEDINMPLDSRLSINKKSKFRFPFDHNEKSESEAFLEIKNALNNLTDNTLLFLTSINKIEYSFENVIGSLERLELVDGIVEIVNTRPNLSEYISSWFRFDKYVEILNEDNEIQKCRISIAFKLEHHKSGKKRLAPLDRGEVSIYFPAESEVSNLFFHLHAPFASTVARDCVRDSSSNNLLRDDLATLLVEAIVEIKEYGYLDVDFLGLLPNSSDNLSNFYKPFREVVVSAFRSQELTPTLSGGFAKSDRLFIGSNEIQKVICDDDLSAITKFDTPLWCKNPEESDLRSTRFLKDLAIDEWGHEELKDFLAGWGNEENLQPWLDSKTDEQLFLLYSLLGKASDLDGLYCGNIYKPIVRSLFNGSVELSTPSETFFPVDKEINIHQEIRYVKPEVYRGFGTKVAQKYAVSFLTEIGVKPYDQKAIVLELLEKYENAFEVSLDDHLSDIKTILAFESENSGQTLPLTYKKFILCNQGGSESYGSIRNIYIDRGYLETNLDEAKSIHGKKRISDVYKEKLSPDELGIFVKLLITYGVFYKLKIEKRYIEEFSHPEKTFLKSGFGNESSRTIDKDFSIPNLKKYIKLNSLCISKLIWDCCLDASSDCFEAVYLRNAQNDERRLDSTLIYILRESSWIPDKDGNLLKPEFVSDESLHPDFIIRRSNNFLDKVGFGFVKKNQSKEYESFKKIIESKGLSVNDVDQVLSLMSNGLNLLELKNFIKQKGNALKPVAKVENLDRRKNNVLADSHDAPSIKSITAERRIQSGIDEVRAKSRAYLRPLYQNVNNELVCQSCHKEMPFKLRSTGEYYFEATQIFKKINSRHYQLRLALCPNCSAMYEHGVELDDSVIIDRILDIDINEGNSHLEVPILILGRESAIFFVEKHIFDIQVLLQKN